MAGVGELFSEFGFIHRGRYSILLLHRCIRVLVRPSGYRGPMCGRTGIGASRTLRPVEVVRYARECGGGQSIDLRTVRTQGAP